MAGYLHIRYTKVTMALEETKEACVVFKDTNRLLSKWVAASVT